MSAGFEPQPLAKALSELVALRGLARVRAGAQLALVWQDVAGPAFAGRTRVLGIRRGVLHVGVAHAPLLGELASFHKTDFVERLKQQHADLRIRDIRFFLRGDLARGSQSSQLDG
jgi:hypothetical protein